MECVNYQVLRSNNNPIFLISHSWGPNMPHLNELKETINPFETCQYFLLNLQASEAIHIKRIKITKEDKINDGCRFCPPWWHTGNESNKIKFIDKLELLCLL